MENTKIHRFQAEPFWYNLDHIRVDPKSRRLKLRQGSTVGSSNKATKNGEYDGKINEILIQSSPVSAPIQPS